MSTSVDLRKDALAIWRAAVAAVDSQLLVTSNVTCSDGNLTICGHHLPCDQIRHIEVVGAGKAGAGMARGLQHALHGLPQHVTVGGWVNVPADCVESLDGIVLHSARPAGVNEPTSEGVEGTREIIRRLKNLTPSDLCIVLISGGGSALLPAPVPQISLADKLAVTRYLAEKGARIDELNTVRSQLSLVKGGGLLQHCNAGWIVTLIISDVIDDPLEFIASGPTAPASTTANDALQVLSKYGNSQNELPSTVFEFLQNGGRSQARPECLVHNHIIGSNAVAVKAAAMKAQSLGYDTVNLGSANCGHANQHGRQLFEQLKTIQLRGQAGSVGGSCLLAGGETTVALSNATSIGKGGRNQEVVMAAVSAHQSPDEWDGICLLSGGTDGEDGPTDAAGAVADHTLICQMKDKGVTPELFLTEHNSYPFFQKLDGLICTGPTHTNVMDLAVGLVLPK